MFAFRTRRAKYDATYRINKKSYCATPTARQVAHHLGFSNSTVATIDKRLIAKGFLDAGKKPNLLIDPPGIMRYGEGDWTENSRYYLLPIPTDKSRLKAMAIWAVNRSKVHRKSYMMQVLRINKTTLKRELEWIASNGGYSPQDGFADLRDDLIELKASKPVAEPKKLKPPAPKREDFSEVDEWVKSDEPAIPPAWMDKYQKHKPAPTPKPVVAEPIPVEIKPDKPKSETTRATYLSERTFNGEVWECSIDKETDIPLAKVRRIAV